MVGSPAKTARKPRFRASDSSSEPGSVMAANASARPPVQCQKKSRWHRVSSVVPDFEEARNSVRAGSRESAARRMAAGCVVSRTCRCSLSNVRRRTSGARLEPPMPRSTTKSNWPTVPAANSSSSATRWRILSGSSSQPSQRFSSRPVQSVESRAQRRSTSSAGASEAKGLRRDELARLRANAFEELREGVGELLDALPLERLCHVGVVDPRLCEVCEDLLRLVDPLLERERRLAVVLEGLDRLLGHRVHRHRTDELRDVHDVAVLGVLGRRRGPERPLRRCALRDEEVPLLAGEELLEALVGELRVRDRELPLEAVVPAHLVEALIGLGVDAADEEARHGGDRARVAATGNEPLEAADVGARDLLVALER